MDRALGYGPRGCGFDSRRVHENPPKDTFGGFFISQTIDPNLSSTPDLKVVSLYSTIFAHLYPKEQIEVLP